jgi:hypothetical protein
MCHACVAPPYLAAGNVRKRMTAERNLQKAMRDPDAAIEGFQISHGGGWVLLSRFQGVSTVGCRVWGVGCRAQGFKLLVLDTGFCVLKL